MTDGQELELPADIDPGVLRLFYDEAQSAIDRQISTVESLNARAGAIMGLAVVVLSIVAAIDPANQQAAVKALLFATTIVFVLSVPPALLAWREREYRSDPRMAVDTVEKLAALEPTLMRAQVLANRLASIEENTIILDGKRRWLRPATLIVGVGICLIVATIFVRLLGADTPGGSFRRLRCDAPWETRTDKRTRPIHGPLMRPSRLGLNLPPRSPHRLSRCG